MVVVVVVQFSVHTSARPVFNRPSVGRLASVVGTAVSQLYMANVIYHNLIIPTSPYQQTRNSKWLMGMLYRTKAVPAKKAKSRKKWRLRGKCGRALFIKGVGISIEEKKIVCP